MIKTRINNEYKDIIKIFGGGALQKEITKVWSREANKYVYESSVEYTGALPITITTDGSTLIDYRIYGNTVQDGTPTPENPVDVIGCGERTVNLAEWVIKKATIGDSGAIGRNPSFNMLVAKVVEGKKYTITASSSSGFVYGFFSAFPAIYSQSYNSSRFIGERTFTAPIDGYIAFRVTLSDTLGMLNLGSTPRPYEPYGYKLPMTIGDGNTAQTVPIYLGEAETTRRIKKLVLTGEEGWRRTANEKCYYIDLANGCPNDYLKQLTTTSICSHYQSQNNTASGSNKVDSGHFCFYIGGGCELYIGETTISSATDFKSYLAAQHAAGTPVTIWYVLANEETGIVNEPLMKIGDYADTLSMEQADVSIPTIAGTTVIDYDGELKPSQMYIKYRR